MCGLIAMWPCGEQRTLTCHGWNAAFSDWLAAEKEILIILNNLVLDLPLQQTRLRRKHSSESIMFLLKDYFTVSVKIFYPDILWPCLWCPGRICLESLGMHCWAFSETRKHSFWISGSSPSFGNWSIWPQTGMEATWQNKSTHKKTPLIWDGDVFQDRWFSRVTKTSPAVALM